jgi:hypothetical protein
MYIVNRFTVPINELSTRRNGNCIQALRRAHSNCKQGIAGFGVDEPMKLHSLALKTS